MMAAVRSTKQLQDLLPEIDGAFAAISVPGLVVDSRQLRPGELFLAFPGENQDGRSYIPQAISAGAGAIIAERGVERRAWPVPVIEVDNLRDSVSAIADRFFDSPSAEMGVIGVTGTNGKTSCTQLLGQALRLAGSSCGVMGTLGASLDGTVTGGGLTTPDPVALQAQLADWRDRSVSSVAMEVSSHGLSQGRVEAVRFTGAVFTNLSRDHLDFHGDMASYGAAKARLFTMPGLQFAVINTDDSFGAELCVQVAATGVRVIRFGTTADTDVRALAVDYRSDGMDVEIALAGVTIQARSQLLGAFNLSNLLAVVAVLAELGLAPSMIEGLIPRLRPITGRMERVNAATDIDVVVDYAHTPDALEQALLALRKHCTGQLWCLFGCGGDRDPGKRPEMGAIAERLADRVVLTSDNPRSEDPLAILSDIRAGMHKEPIVSLDRNGAIHDAIQAAATGDLLLLAGKGHEEYQLINGQRRPFSDVAAARAALLARQRGGCSA